MLLVPRSPPGPVDAVQQHQQEEGANERGHGRLLTAAASQPQDPAHRDGEFVEFRCAVTAVISSSTASSSRVAC
jgi:hypothetical protein